MEYNKSTPSNISCFRSEQRSCLPPYSGFNSLFHDWDLEIFPESQEWSSNEIDSTPQRGNEISCSLEAKNCSFHAIPLPTILEAKTENKSCSRSYSYDLGSHSQKELNSCNQILVQSPTSTLKSRVTSTYFQQPIGASVVEHHNLTLTNEKDFSSSRFPHSPCEENKSNLGKDVSSNTDIIKTVVSSPFEQQLQQIVDNTRKTQKSISDIVAKQIAHISLIEDTDERIATHKWFLNHELMKIYYKEIPQELKLISSYLSKTCGVKSNPDTPATSSLDCYHSIIQLGKRASEEAGELIASIKKFAGERTVKQ